MTNTNTPKQIKNAPSEALREPENIGKGEKQAQNQESESSKEYLIEVKSNPSKIVIPNSFQSLTAGPMFDEIEIERREQYQFSNFIR